VLRLFDKKIENFNRMYEINKQLLEILENLGFNIVNFSKKYNYPLPSNFSFLVGKAKNLIHELNHPTNINKGCSVCNKLNPENAEYCCYCGSSLVITRMRQDDDNTRKGDRTLSRLP